ncbi:tyrosine-type recombinase/integrase [Vibrio ouci]|uniref:Integrase n=1 Tax=Vibrio ouci TaxID=2499078 RepID=A0A4Y8WDB3_9VIBR|nr:tyrosine-type recombinase/integrase [Vibrio ouci]TFH90261.1 integrase [Vibrio ouci]
MSTLSILGQQPFDRLLPHEFAQGLASAQRAGEVLEGHPLVEAAIAHYQQEFFQRAERLQPATLVRLRSAWATFVAWCCDHERCALPASAQTVEQYLIAEQSRLHRNTLKVQVWAISKTHRISGCPDPCQNDYVKAQLQQIHHRKVRQREVIRQAIAFRETHLDRLTNIWGAPTASLTELRDLLIVSVLYETLLRKSNVETLRVADIEWQRDGTGLVKVYVTKTDKSGDVRYSFLSGTTMDVMERYLAHPEISDAPDAYLIQRTKLSSKQMKGQSRQTAAMDPVSAKLIGRVCVKASAAVGLDADRHFTGHSARVGATQDLLSEGFSSLQVQQAGGWSSERMVLRYGGGVLASESAMAQRRRAKRPS